MKNLTFTLVALGLLAANLSNAALYADENWISLQSSGPFKLSAIVRFDTITFPLTIQAGLPVQNIKLESTKPVFVRTDNEYENRYIDAFIIQLNVNGTITLITDLTKLTATGNYDVIARFSAPNLPQRDLVIPVTRQPAILQEIPKIEIDIIRWGNNSSDPIFIKEKGKKSGIRNLALHSPVFKKLHFKKLITFAKPNLTLQADSGLFVPYEINDQATEDLEVGEVLSGTMELSPPELQAPITVNFEVTTKLSPYFIFLIVFLGVFFGWIVRVLLKRKIEMEELKYEGTNLIAKIQKESGSVKDADYQTTITALVSDLVNSINKAKGIGIPGDSSVEELKTEIQGHLTHYTNERASLSTKLTGVEANIASLSNIFENDRFPVAILNNLDKSSKAYKESKTALLDQDAKTAVAKVAYICNDTNEFFNNYLRQVIDLATQLSSSGNYPICLDADFVTTISAKIGQLNAIISKISLTKNGVDSAVENAKSISTVHEELIYLLNALLEGANRKFEEIKSRPTSPAMIKFIESANLWNNNIEAIIEDPLYKLDLSKKTTLDTDWAVLIATFPRVIQEAAVNNAGTFFFPGSRFSGRHFTNTTVIFNIKPDEIQFSLSRVRRNWFIYSILQTTAFFILISLTAYKVYSPGFVGTFSECITMFLFTFTLNITVENLNSTWPKLKV